VKTEIEQAMNLVSRLEKPSRRSLELMDRLLLMSNALDDADDNASASC
jgi:hypothetical protein